MSTQFTNRQWRLPNNENKDKQSNYSMDFDSASSDYIEIYSGTVGNLPSAFSIGASDSQTISCWVKSNVTTSNNFIWLQRGTNPYLRLFLNYNSGTDSYRAGLSVRDDSNVQVSEISDSTNSVNRNQWNHIAAVIDRTNAKLYVYVNGVVTGTGTALGSLGAITQITDVNIGRDSAAGGRYYFDGQIDAVSIFNYALSSSQVTTLYGSSSTGIGNPMSLSTKPVAFYQLGDKSAFNGANYLVPNIAAEEADGDIATSYSPYALDFDSASGDFIKVLYNNSSGLNLLSNFSVSIWINIDSSGFRNPAISNYNNAGGFGIELRGTLATPLIRFMIRDSVGLKQATAELSLVQTGWHHIVGTFDGTTLKIYTDSVKGTDKTAASNMILSTSYLAIGSDPIGNRFDGKLSNASYWNTALTQSQVSELYNEGVPSNLNNHSAYSNLVSWWQLGSNSSYTNKWICLDEKGTNNGESVNMGEDAIVDGVGSYANGLSSGMGGDEVIGDAPYSSSNALSVNMDVEDRVTDTPS